MLPRCRCHRRLTWPSWKTARIQGLCERSHLISMTRGAAHLRLTLSCDDAGEQCSGGLPSYFPFEHSAALQSLTPLTHLHASHLTHIDTSSLPMYSTAALSEPLSLAYLAEAISWFTIFSHWSQFCSHSNEKDGYMSSGSHGHAVVCLSSDAVMADRCAPASDGVPSLGGVEAVRPAPGVVARRDVVEALRAHLVRYTRPQHSGGRVKRRDVSRRPSAGVYERKLSLCRTQRVQEAERVLSSSQEQVVEHHHEGGKGRRRARRAVHIERLP